jgi:hypothetical protein
MSSNVIPLPAKPSDAQDRLDAARDYVFDILDIGSLEAAKALALKALAAIDGEMCD